MKHIDIYRFVWKVLAKLPLDYKNENRYHIFMDKRSSSAKPAPGIGPDAAAIRPRRTTSRELLGDGDELVIEHDGREYRLRRTQNGKLILTA